MLHNIKGIQFGIFNSDDIIKNSVVKVEYNDVYDKGIPKYGGLSDLRMGTCDRAFNCQTCHGDIITCPGHFGHIDLCHPVFHPGYVKTVVKILSNVCFNCSELLCPDEKLNNKLFKLNNKKRFKYISSLSKSKNKCKNCDLLQPKFTLESMKIIMENEEGEKNYINAKQAKLILKRITKQNAAYLGFGSEYTEPEHMIISVIPVPPPQVRPSVTMDSSLKSQDDLTHKLAEIVRSNSNLQKALQTNANVNDFINLLQFHVTTFIDNEIPGQPQATQRTGRPIKGINQRLKAKEGRVRGNLMGKRVDYSARTVITAEPNIMLDELGVPIAIARNLTYPERVTSFNKDILQQFVDNGHDPEGFKTGAKYVTKKDGNMLDLRFVKKLDLEVGDVVDRHLKDNDLIVFNRQPTLHRMSMMGHKVKVMSGSTFRMNLSATTPYNADYDGDEMNLHMPQTLLTKTEIQELMMVPKCIVSQQSNKPVIGIIQDALLGCRKITKRDTFVNKATFTNILMCIRSNNFTLPKPAILKPKELWTGKQIINLILPKFLSFSRKSGWASENDTPNFSVEDTEVFIKNGDYLSGILCKKSLGTSEGGLIHRIWLDYGHEDTNWFISNVQFIVNHWLLYEGFSIGAKDLFTSEDVQVKVKQVINDSMSKVKHIIKIKEHSNIDFESKINQALNNAMQQAGKVVQDNIGLNNNINTTVSSGSKGSVINIAQIMACVGQQNVSGKRINVGYNNRALSHFEPNDISPEACGFVKHSYLSGLDPHEFFFHMMGGREGIIDTAVKTSETGYIQRRLIKAMEDLKVTDKKYVHNSIGDIVTFVYGDDGFDGCYLRSSFVNNNKQYTPFDYDVMIKKVRNTKTNAKGISKYKYNKFCKSVKDKFVILDGDDYITTKLNAGAVSKIKLQFDSYFSYEKVKILTSEELILLENEIMNTFNKAKVTNGECVGIIAAQSIGEPTTQLTLNTFHSAGIGAKNVTLGVPRFKELINVAKTLKSPSMYITLNATNQKESDVIASKLESLHLKDICKSFAVCSKDEFLDHNFIYFDIFDIQVIKNTFIRYTIDPYKLKDSHLSLITIGHIVNNTYESLHCVHNNENCDVVYLDIFLNKEEISTNYEYYRLGNKILHKTNLTGVDNITKAYISCDNFTNEWIIETEGSNLKNMLTSEHINPTMTWCNDPLEIYETLGIEAARRVLLDEIRKVIEFDGSYVNIRHFNTLIDTMTYKGEIMSITRHGINRSETGPLMRCSFEETVDVLNEASIFAEYDKLAGVTENIMLGKMASVGTGESKIFFNENIYEKNINL